MQTAMCAALATVGMASAFVAPSSFAGNSLAVKSAQSSTKMMAGSEYTDSIPGKPFPDQTFVFDPLGLSKGASPADIKKWREAELKHGRVAMMAALGTVVQENFHPLFLGNDYVGPAIYHFQEIQARFPAFWLLTLLAIAVVEGENITRGWQKEDPREGVAPLKEDYINGDLGFDPLNLMPDNEEDFNVLRTKELNNGRLAMIAVMGFWAQELVNQKGIIENLSS